MCYLSSGQDHDAASDPDATVRADLLQRLAGVAWKQRDEAVAASYAGLAVDLLSTMLGERHLLTAAAQLLHSRLRLARGDFAGAQEQLEAVLAQVGDMEGAVHHARTALEARAAANIGDDVEAAEVLRILGRGCVALGDLASGRAAFGRALEVLITVYRPEAPETRELRAQITALDAGKLLAVPPTWN